MEKVQKSNSANSSLYVLVILAFLSYVALTVLTFLNYTDAGCSLFYKNFTMVYTKYSTELTPDSTTRFAIHVITAVWNAAILVYFLASFCLSPDQSPVKTTPTLTPKVFLISFTVSCISLIGWLFMFDREQLVFAFIFLMIACGSLWKSIRASLILVHDFAPIIELKSKAMLWLMRILVHNGLTFYAATLTGDFIVAFAMSMIYKDSFGKPTAEFKGGFTLVNGSTMALAAFLVIIFLFFVVESVAYEEYFRFVISVFLALVAYFAAIVVRLQRAGNNGQNFIIAVATLSVCIAWSIARIVVFVFQILEAQAKIRLYSLKKSDKSLVGQI